MLILHELHAATNVGAGINATARGALQFNNVYYYA